MTELLDVRELAALLDVSDTWCYQHLAEIPHVTLPGGKLVRFRAGAIAEWLAGRERYDAGREPGTSRQRQSGARRT